MRPFEGQRSAGFGYAAWDVALATQSLAYIDPELVAVIAEGKITEIEVIGDPARLGELDLSVVD